MNLYAERDIEGLDRAGKYGLGNYYSRHVSAMTAEGLHSKSAIAAELAHRDMMIERHKRRADWFEQRLNALQQAQKGMRDPERKMVCDILANGETYVTPNKV